MVARFVRVWAIAILAVAIVAPAEAVPIVYSTDASFLAAAGATTFEGFETASAGVTSVSFTGGTFSCSGTSYCPGFFGISSAFADTGTHSVFFATPDSATFAFSSPINAFGLAIGGAGDVAPITLTALLSNGSSVLALTDYTGPFTVFGTNRQYFGVIDSVPFTSVTFTGSNSADGIFFDTMNYGGTVVPEPATLLLFGTGLIGACARRWRKPGKTV